MSISEQERQAEQRRVEQVVAEIGRQIDSLSKEASDVGEDIVSIRKHFWDDVTVNFDDAVEAADTYASIKQQAEVLSERERVHQHALQRLKTLKRLAASPYFGRIDFREESEAHAEPIYLGIASVQDESDEQFLVYDWRAPISSLYYDYAPGPVTYETPAGSISGEMTAKRQYVIRDGRLLHVFDTGVTIGDELLQEVLGKQADNQMKSIVATIQKEQNQIIRNERSRLLIVSGAAGSGKTSAAMQRIAYLLYRYRQSLRADQIVLFSPNRLFSSYVSTVLPELGEENMEQSTFQEYAEHRLGSLFALEHPLAHMEAVLQNSGKAGYATRLESIRFKSSARFLQVLDSYVQLLMESGMVFRDLLFREHTIISGEQIKDYFYSLERSLPIPNRLHLAARWLLSELKKRERSERRKPWVDDELELLDKDDFVQTYQQLRRKNQFHEESFDDFDRERDALAAKVVKRAFRELRTWIKQLRFLDAPAVYRQFFAEESLLSKLGVTEAAVLEHWPAICARTIRQLDQGQLSYEDTPAFLYLLERLEGQQTNNLVRHVFLDEAQDYSPFQFALLKRLFPRAKMTVLGDWNQAIYAHAQEQEGFAAVASLYAAEETETVVLAKSYRSTRPIVLFTRQLIAGGEQIEPFQRDGRLPTITSAANSEELAEKISARVHELQAKGHNTIAVITKTAEEARLAHARLRENLPIQLLDSEQSSYDTGVLVIPAYLAKGVEFDAVLLYDASRERYADESERKLFYTACTRAMHELHLYFIGEISPFLSSVSPDSYEMC
ncbi:RNA polymerase recycling motor HelD [Brevibacillus sp. TJ4]|uniref:RNA polymerase recycling motor HelD n=1 Tax=Brevibacillus sp. TJ4 TaxID=3234853 RepID=UPI0037D9036E